MKKNFHCLRLAAIALLLAGVSLHGQPAPEPAPPRANSYDVLGRVLTPIVSIFCKPAPSQGGSAKKKPRALTATLTVQEMTGAPAELIGGRVTLSVEPPSRLIVHFPYNGKTVTICRNDQQVWTEPRGVLSEFAPQVSDEAADAGADSKKPRKRKETAIPPIGLPLPAQQLAFLPVLFTVKDAGDAQGMRILDARLIPELAKSLGVPDWSARLFVRSADDSHPGLGGLELARPGWHIAVRVESLEYFPELPAATWKPSPDAVCLTGTQARQWLEEVGFQFAPPPE